MAYLKVRGITIHYDSFGNESSEAILLIAGLGTQMIRWTELFCEGLVAKGFRVIRFDNRDVGRSTHFTDAPALSFSDLSNAIASGRQPEVPYTLYDMVEDTIGLLDALMIDRAHIVGRSMGGMIAQLMASEYPERVLSLTSMMSSTGNPNLPPTESDVMDMLTKRVPHPFEDETGFLEHNLAFAKRIASPGFPFDEKAHRILVMEEASRAYDPVGFGRQIAAIAATGDIRPQLSKIVAPTLVVHGTDDVLISPACGEDTAASIPKAEFMLIHGMGHDLPAELYPKVVDAIDGNARRQVREREFFCSTTDISFG
jgi:pimeloyl-ACP methyl ester carboxylesterase